MTNIAAKKIDHSDLVAIAISGESITVRVEVFLCLLGGFTQPRQISGAVCAVGCGRIRKSSTPR
jgi:hypothetical protein